MTLTCKICGHDMLSHFYAPEVVCQKCPNSLCQNGIDGKKFRGEV